jgi:hypothetical protein
VWKFHKTYQMGRGIPRNYNGNAETHMLEDASNNANSPATAGQIGGAEPPVISGAQRLFQSGLQSLSRVRGHHHGKNFNKIMYNIEVLVFCLWWFRMVDACRWFLSFG